MAKRFTDTEKYKKSFIKSLPAPYKILLDYVCLDCNHAGIWHKDFEIAQRYIGQDAPVEEQEALYYFNKDEERVLPFDNNEKWLIKPFVEFQYGNLNPKNRVHASILAIVQKSYPQAFVNYIKPLISPLQGAKDMDKDMDMDKEECEKPFQAPARKECGYCEGSGKLVRGPKAGQVCFCVRSAPPLPRQIKNVPKADCEYCSGVGFIYKDEKNLLCGCWVGPTIKPREKRA